MICLPDRNAILSLAILFAVVFAVSFGPLTTAPAQFAPAQAAVPDAHVDKLRLGAHWAGPKIEKDTLLGKVVLVELWGS